MRSVNKVILVGNLTRDPELKSTTGGQAICTFGIATNRQWKDQNGEQRDLAEFHEITAWSRRAEVCHQILKKGNLIYIEGYLKTRSWLDEETQKKRYRTEVVVDDVIKLEKRPLNATAAEFAPTAENETEGENTPLIVPNETEGEAATEAFGGEETAKKNSNGTKEGEDASATF
ncbi:single-stranded DNA-binding protein [Patescibacteria group bacterium]|nr:single-stranded DNA-binding protein [Patescibacteria group bacterium]